MFHENQLPYMLRLLDDDEPAIQEALREEFSASSGDLSNELAALAIDLKPADSRRLSQLLQLGRREMLMQEWHIPQGGANALNDDWESFEDLLRLISDFLHDGVTLRPSLPDQLDMLAEEAIEAEAHRSENILRQWLFESKKFIGNQDFYYAAENSDLCWCIESGLGNPISLSLIYMLVARRLDLEVTGCNYPGHFLARIHIDAQPMLIDCFHKGNIIPVAKILEENKNISTYAKETILTNAPLGHIILRILRNLEHSFNKMKCTEDAKIFKIIFEQMNQPS